MSTWELTAFSTEERGECAVRHRVFTVSEVKARAWRRIPRIQFTDSGHGIVFAARRVTSRAGLPEKRAQQAHVDEHLPDLLQAERELMRS